MKKIIMALAIGMVSAWGAAQTGGALKAHPDSKAWDDVFAPDLANAVCPPGIWSWKDGELSPHGEDEAIWSKKEYENFILDLEFKLVTDLNMKDWTSGKKNPDGSAIPPLLPRPLAEMATKGHVGLQGAHGGIPAHYRNIKIKLLG